MKMSLEPVAIPRGEGWPGYAEQLVRARERSGVSESVTVSVEKFGELDAVCARLHFDFMGGSMGIVHGDRIVAGIELACELGVPFISIVASGGARTQEGYASLFQMVRTSEAVRLARSRGIPMLAWFTSPTMGGVHASYGAAADLIMAVTGSTVGFSGHRVVEAITGQSVGGDSHNAEAYLRSGLIDAIMPAENAQAEMNRWVRIVHPDNRRTLDSSRRPRESDSSYTGWDAVERARSAIRPTVRELVRQVFDESIEICGDRTGSDDPVMMAVLARLDGETVVVVGPDRSVTSVSGSGLRGAPGAAGFRKARRAFALAERWSLPVVTLIDTSGADPHPQSDNAGLASSISETLVSLLSVRQPTIAVVTGEGGSGGAMSLGGVDRLLMQDDAVFEVIAPEGAAAIVYRDSTRAVEAANNMLLDAQSLRSRGYSDHTLPGPTTVGPEESTAAIRLALKSTLAELSKLPRARLLADRSMKLRSGGRKVKEIIG